MKPVRHLPSKRTDRRKDNAEAIQVPIVAALVAFTPAVAWSQSTANDLDPAVTTPVEQHDDEDFPWGLLGLLGLAGLFGLKRRDDNVTVDRSTSKNRM